MLKFDQFSVSFFRVPPPHGDSGTNRIWDPYSSMKPDICSLIFGIYGVWISAAAAASKIVSCSQQVVSCSQQVVSCSQQELQPASRQQASKPASQQTSKLTSQQGGSGDLDIGGLEIWRAVVCLFVVWCMLFVVCCLLFVVCCLLFVVCCLLFAVGLGHVI